MCSQHCTHAPGLNTYTAPSLISLALLKRPVLHDTFLPPYLKSLHPHPGPPKLHGCFRLLCNAYLFTIPYIISLVPLCITGPLFLPDRYGFMYYLLLCSQDPHTTDLILCRMGDSAPNIAPNRECTYALLSLLLHHMLNMEGHMPTPLSHYPLTTTV